MLISKELAAERLVISMDTLHSAKYRHLLVKKDGTVFVDAGKVDALIEERRRRDEALEDAINDAQNEANREYRDDKKARLNE